MYSQRYKYPRTPHLSFSPGVGGDDLQLDRDRFFINSQVVVTEKLDGENTSLYQDYIHARSLDSRQHPSRAWVKALQASIGHDIPSGWRICGENLYARHSIAYEDLNSYFYLFSIWNQDNYCLSWAETQEWAEILGLTLPKVMYKGLWDEKKIRAIATNLDLDVCEGFVVRKAEQFHYDDFAQNIAKWVRLHHVQSDEHWMYQEVIPNQLSIFND
ncbi:RNA ligase family protein [Waterburya agarophytonicola K14]|uniref:RNA ligase family protein n=1 Tax=Waterburya agarophytonicola KI4 TaxID=2874699 RepID=A0A964BSD4_9CYAN|nr:RNA ligase family protein [Waterburya agarophytonicola]MCC0178254.1 RNA ligase family protein [Waterburya agarophytonicola KI4]